MLRGNGRNRRALAVIGVLLLGASSARAAVRFERPDRVAEHDAIWGLEAPGDTRPDRERIEAARGLAQLDETTVARRVGELRQPAEARVAIGWLAPVHFALAAGNVAQRGEIRSGPAGVARWCLAHATSTQAP